MNAVKERSVRIAARDLLLQLWKRRNDFWLKTLSPHEFLRSAPETTVTEILGFRLEKPEEIRPDSTQREEGKLSVETAGFVDRRTRRVVIAQKFDLPWRRFTTAHEIGHIVLHPDLIYHRDLPLLGGERANNSRPIHEQEADLFAAEFLMPSKFLRKTFLRCFGQRIDGTVPNQNLAFELSAGTGRKINALELASRDPMYRALLIAKTSTFNGSPFVPFAEQFGVSPTAMAIQLLDLDLVK